MSHVPEIDAENRYHRFLARLVCNSVPIFFWYQFSVTNGSKTMLYFRAGVWYQFCGMGFRRRFLERASLIVLDITLITAKLFLPALCNTAI